MQKDPDFTNHYIEQTEAQKEMAFCRYQFAHLRIEDWRTDGDSIRWLDVGSNMGVGIPDCNPNTTKLLLSDSDMRYLRLQDNEYPKTNFDARDIPFMDNCCDVISCFETIEHIELEDVYKFLKEVHRVLKEDSLFFLSTPNRDANGKRKCSHEHKQEFNKQELIHILETYGFEVLEIFGQNIANKKNILHRIFLRMRQSSIVGKIYDSMPSSLVHFVRNESIGAFGNGDIREVTEKGETERIIYLICRKKVLE